MLYSIAYIFRRPDLTPAQFRDHYETRHTQLAAQTLPRFTHYVRNHVVESAGTIACPDVISEFGYADAQQLAQAMGILRDARGQALLEDELLFMDKPRNQPFAAGRWDWSDPTAPQPGSGRSKYVLRFEAETAPGQPLARLQILRKADPALRRVALCAPADVVAGGPLPCWLCWSDEYRSADQRWQRLRGEGLASCAGVEEVVGYPPSGRA